MSTESTESKRLQSYYQSATLQQHNYLGELLKLEAPESAVKHATSLLHFYYLKYREIKDNNNIIQVSNIQNLQDYKKKPQEKIVCNTSVSSDSP